MINLSVNFLDPSQSTRNSALCGPLRVEQDFGSVPSPESSSVVPSSCLIPELNVITLTIEESFETWSRYSGLDTGATYT